MSSKIYTIVELSKSNFLQLDFLYRLNVKTAAAEVKCNLCSLFLIELTIKLKD